VRLLAFFLLALYGVHRWGTLLSGGAGARLAGMLFLTTLLAVVGPVLAARHRLLAVPLAVFVVAATLAAAGLPVSWIVNLRVSVSANAIGQGLGALAGILLPYAGVNDWVRMTILLGAGVLLLDAALVLTFVPRHRGQLRRAGAAFPLVALAVIPATLLRPPLAYVQGVLLFALLVLFMWGERIRARRLGAVVAPCLVVATVALALAPGLDRHHPWINYRALATSLAPRNVETFDWNQGYGPLNWPHSGKTVAEIQATHPDYWKVADLDEFDGSGWTASINGDQVPWQTAVSPAAMRRWTHTIQVTLRLMNTHYVIASGSAYQPTHLSETVSSGADTGSWQTADRLGPGVSYRVRVYSPHPSALQLRTAGVSYPPSIAATYLSILVPEPGTLPGPPLGSSVVPVPRANVIFPPFGSAASAAVMHDIPLVSTLRASPYESAFALARRLAAGAPTPYAYLQRVERFLRHGYAYTLHTRSSRYPLTKFLFSTKRGYCQHFAGAMALLLRMGGVPARVAVGFTDGSYDAPTHGWLVADTNAHAWVEAWFPKYGWVGFDPTPTADPALRDLGTEAAGGLGGVPGRSRLTLKHRDQGSAPLAGTRHGLLGPRRASGGETGLIIALAMLAILLLGVALLTRARRGQDLVGELARAFYRSGRPLSDSVTLASMERRLEPDWPQAAAYVRALRLARFAPGSSPPTLRQRRALRGALAQGLGILGRVRAWWALPPRWGASHRP
jgi:transglutaminase-like putative cysteine protease